MNQTAAAGQASVEKNFIRYVFQNILGMLGISAYVLADTYFIAQAEGAVGITALNLVLPVYSFLFAIGSMIGVGSATRFKIHRAREEDCADSYFSNAFLFTLFFGLLFMAAGAWIPDRIVSILGGDEEIMAAGTPYTRIFLLFSPFFMWNYIFNAFVRNDGAPALAMMATLFSSLFNIVMDYILMFPLGLGMAGAALATAVSPIVGIAICSIHFFSAKNTIRFRLQIPSFRRLVQSCQLGTAAFVGEISSGVTTIVFNFLILKLAGNIGVAAYGIVANTAIVATSVFNGISQGSQPLLSDFHGRGDRKSLKKVLLLSVGSSVFMALLILLAVNLLTGPLVALFNSEQNPVMAAYAADGMRLYFTGFLFAGFNIVGTGYLSATEAAGWAFAASVLRGFVAIIICAFVLAGFFGMTGIWLAFPAAELITSAVTAVSMRLTLKSS